MRKSSSVNGDREQFAENDQKKAIKKGNSKVLYNKFEDEIEIKSNEHLDNTN